MWKPDWALLRLLGAGHGRTTSDPLTKAYYAQLCCVPRLSGRHAIAVLRRYPTLRQLLDAWRQPEHADEKSKAAMLQDLLVEPASGDPRRFGPALSARVYQAFNATDPTYRIMQ
jgi:hypothetical protein